MKLSLKIRPVAVLFLFILSLFTSCRKDDEGSVYSYYVASEPIISYTTSQMKGLIDFASFSLPDLVQMKPLVKSDVDVFKIVYKTVIKGQDVNASALLCLPSDPGNYPVLSFQNGTNTQYSNAPTEAATSLTYQLIEVVASMGFIVVATDYPGFGESTNVVHPYLVKEPTVSSTVDLFRAVGEMTESGEPGGIGMNKDYYLIGYSQGDGQHLHCIKTWNLSIVMKLTSGEVSAVQDRTTFLFFSIR